MLVPPTVNGTLTLIAEVPVTVTVKLAEVVPASVMSPSSPALRTMAMLSASFAEMVTVAAWLAVVAVRVTAPAASPLAKLTCVSAATVAMRVSPASATASLTSATSKSAVVSPAETVTVVAGAV